MPDLELVKPLVAAYRQSADSASDAVLHHHSEAMVVRDIEEVVAFGIYVMDLWFRRIEAWHVWVSESSSRYRIEDDKLNQLIEQQLLDIGRRFLDLTKKVAGWGYTFERLDEFKTRLLRMESSGQPIGTAFQKGALSGHFAAAVDEASRGTLEQSPNPWSAA